MNSSNWTVRRKLLSAFGALAVLVLIVAGLSIRSIGEANERFTSYVNGINARATMAGAVRTAVDRRAIAARNLVLVTKPEDLEAEKSAVAQAHQDVQANLAKLKELAQDPSASDQVRSMIGDIDKVEQTYGPIALGIVKLALDHKRDEAIAKMNDECRPALASLIKATDTYLDATHSREKAMIESAEAAYALQRNLLVVACLVAFTAAAAFGFFITRSLTRALGSEPAILGAIAQRVADGDLSAVEGAAAAPAGSVLSSLGNMQVSLANIVGKVRSASDSIATGSAQIASGNADLSQRTEQQASALEETAATMEQLGSTVKINSESAKQANQLAKGATEVAAKGGQVVSQVVETMKGINDSSKKIADIIGVIDGIAFQTNILALNAAVEAARAGEQGRGFAVVAAEVRNLAQRSAAAAKEIKTLITDSVDQVGKGTELVDQAGKTMEEIVGAIRRVTDIVGEISSASVEQSSGVNQVGEAVAQMDQVTQQNAALVEESAAAAESLRQQAQELVEAVAVFKTQFGAGGSPSASKAAPHAADAAERRSPNRATNIVRPKFGAGSAKNPYSSTAAASPQSIASVTKTGTDDWQSF
jgi:methyl-accepting chemotaxis protein-1 (serine sensor receptor)